MKIGILREGKIPHDKRVPFTPVQCKLLLEEFPDLQLAVQPSPFRCFSDEEYRLQGIQLQDDLRDCDVLMGIKEVPVSELIAQKRYFFFSHTIKKQAHNRNLLKSILDKGVELVDYECLVDAQDNRVIGFGRYAGLVGAYNGLMAYGLKYGLFELKHAQLCHDKKELFAQLENISLPNIKIVVTGGGRVANCALEVFGVMGLRKVTAFEFLNYAYREL
ncbi:MAG: alanine dehydrogenase, partial [Bacteroidota bacterium]